MTRRDYIAVATLIRNQMVVADRARDEEFANGIRFGMLELAHGFVRHAQTDSDRFDAGRFFEAAGIEDPFTTAYTLSGKEVR